MPGPYFGLESFSQLTFHDLQGRLIALVVTKIRNGEFTERCLARVLGVSQPQLHNVLKGARPLKPEFADRLLHHFQIGILDLVGRLELTMYLEMPAPADGWTYAETGRVRATGPMRKTVGKVNRSGATPDRLAG
jgi:plasmid maintenance system antidote protein VapI